MEKIKHFLESESGKDILTVIIVILVGLSCFELGRLSKENSSSGVKIEYPAVDTNQGSSAIMTSQTGQAQDIEPAQNTQQAARAYPVKQISNPSDATSKSFFASNRGSKYYSIGCSGGKTIKQENRIYFKTGDEAQRAGYTLSSSCR